MISGQSAVMRNQKRSILKAADCNSTVLITGESGTGKEIIARSIHELGAQQHEPFLAINCGALAESLSLNCLAVSKVRSPARRPTRKECSSQQVRELSSWKNLEKCPRRCRCAYSVLQEHKVRPVGSDSKEVNFNARVVVATNRDLRREVAEGRFRQDLYYRVNVFPIWSPALRDRLDDLPLLIDVLLNKYVDSSKLVRALHFDSDAFGLLQNYSWPGNVRELENLIERLAVNAPPSGLVTAAVLSFDLEFNSLSDPDKPREFILSTRLNCLNNSADSVRYLLDRQELDSYLRELAHVGGDVTKAARRLGLKRTTLHMRIKRLERKLASLPPSTV
jgi:transcriptional regulator with PAS, ATPase and Fis domain